MARRKGGRKTLSELMAAVYPAREPAELEATRAFRWWDRAVPERVAKNARPVRLIRGVLHLHVTTSAWAQELQFLKADLLKRVQQHGGQSAVRDIRFKVGPLPDLPMRTEYVPVRPTALSVAELPEEVARALVQVRDESLRDALTSAATLTLKTKKTK